MTTCSPILDFLTIGRFWLLKCLAAVLLATVVFVCTPAVLMPWTIELTPAYQLKAEHPFADTATLTIPEDEGERSHGGKLSPRLFPSLLLHGATSAGLSPYLPATLGGILLLAAGILLGHQVSGDRKIGLFTGLVLAGSHAASASFAVNFVPKPFDGVALGLVALTAAVISRPHLFGSCAFLSCWSDERSLISLVLIAWLVTEHPDLPRNTKLQRILLLAGMAILWLSSRFLLARLLGWTPVNTRFFGLPLQEMNFSLLLLTAWICFKGGWITILYSGWLLLRKKCYLRVALLTLMAAATIFSCLVVLDISRASCFAFPLVFVAMAIISGERSSPRLCRTITGISAAISLLMPNYELIFGAAFIRLKSLPQTLFF